MGNQITRPVNSQQSQKEQLHKLVSQGTPSNISIKASKIIPQPISSISNRSSTDIFLVDHVSQVSLQIPFHQIQFLWIDKRVYSDEMVNVIHRFNNQLENFEEFKDVEQFKLNLQRFHGNTTIRVISSVSLLQQAFQAMNKCRYVDRIILFCQNLDRASQLRKRHSKILQCGATSLQILQMAGDQCTYKNSILFMLPQDIPVINKYWINYFCLRKHQDRQYAKEHFLDLALEIYPEQKALINEFNLSYIPGVGGAERQRLVKQWMFRDSFYWNLVQKLPKVTNDPKKLAYLRGPFKDIYETIENYYKMIRNQVLNRLRTVHIVVELSDEQKQKIQSCLNNYMTFTSFVKGFTNVSAANNYMKSQENRNNRNIFVFEVTIPPKSKLYQALDHGYILYDDNKIGDRNSKGPDIIFNIFNYFKITDIKTSAKSGILLYGGLADAYRRRENKEHRKILEEREKYSLASYDRMSNEEDKILDQGTVLRLSGHVKDSIVHCESKISNIESQIQSVRKSTQSIMQIDQINLQKGASLLLTQNYSAAINTYLQVKSTRQKLIANVRIIGIYLDQNDEKNARKYFESIMDEIEKLKDWNLHEQYFRAKHYRYRLLMIVKNYDKAYTQYKELKNQIQKHYDYKGNVVPFWNEIIDNFNKCSQMKNKAPIV